MAGAGGGGTVGGASGGLATGIGGFLRHTAQTLLDAPWQIVEIAKTGDPGVYRLWALIATDLHAIKLIVPHIFYVNQKTPKEGEGASKKFCIYIPLYIYICLLCLLCCCIKFLSSDSVAVFVPHSFSSRF